MKWVKITAFVFSSILVAQCATAQPASPVDALKITDDGIGTISATTAVDLAIIQKTFPKYDVKADQTYSEGEPTGKSIKVSNTQKLLFEINSAGVGSKKLFSVVIHDSQYTTSLGLHVGSRVEDILSASSKSTCSRGFEETQDEVHCILSPPNIIYVFPLRGSEEENAGIGKPVKIASAQGRKIVAIVWKPKRQK